MSVWFDCLWCGTPKKTTASNIKNGKQMFCSTKHYRAAVDFKGKCHCPNCGKEFDKTGRSLFCCEECEKHGRWKERRTTNDLLEIECGNPDCKTVFKQIRNGQKYCCKKCSDRVRHLRNMKNGFKPKRKKKKTLPVDPWKTIKVIGGDGLPVERGCADFVTGMWL